MKNAMRLLGAAAIVAATIAVTTTTAGADAAVTTSTTTCGTFTASGTTDSEFYVVEVYDDDTDEDLLWEAYPAVDGTFSFTLTWTAPEAGTPISYYVWGSPTDDRNDYDDGAYFQLEQVPCVADAPTTTTTEAPVTPSAFIVLFGASW